MKVNAKMKESEVKELTVEEQVAAMTMKEITEAFARITGKQVNRFSTKGAAKKRLLDALKETPGAQLRTPIAVAPEPEPPEVIAEKEADPSTPPPPERRSGKRGRRETDQKYKVGTGGNIRLQKSSLRAQLLEWMATRPDSTASVEEINAQFKRDMNGVIQKLQRHHFISRVRQEATK
jgi:hypothetical protein